MIIRALEIFVLENSSWLRSLDYMEQENDFLKNNLSRILDSFSEKELVNWADEYQGIILQREAAMNLLRQDIFKQEALIASVRYNYSSKTKNQIVLAQKEIRTKIEYMEKEFQLLKTSFISDVERITSFN
ncbi:MAG: hypothetical protein ACK50E_00865 [Bacteroidota bacterium]